MSATGQQLRLEVTGVTKRFQGQTALEGASLELLPGEIHALLGQNGSGKSTLIKVLAGYHQPDDAKSCLVDGHPYELGSPAAARASGLRFIHQDLGLIAEFDIADNLALGERYCGRWWLSDRRERRAAESLLREYDIDIDGATLARSLTAAQRSMLAIIRSLSRQDQHGGVLVLDEPTAALPDHEVRQLFDLLERVRNRGTSVLYVTHRLGEVFHIANRVTVLRDGKNVGTRNITDLDHASLVAMIIGRPVDAFYPDVPERGGEVMLDAAEITGDSVRGASITATRGEIVGVTGLIGSGYEHLLALIFGSRPRVSGEVTVSGVRLGRGTIPEAIAAGLAYAPADRKGLASWADWTLRENVTIPAIPSRGPLRWMAARSERIETRPWLEQVSVVPADPEFRFSSLSGGNQQKVVLSRWLRCGARVFLLDEPTNGVDLGAKHAIYEELAATVARGASVVISSSDVEELCAVCDRVLIMRRGRVGAILEGDRLTEDEVLIESTREDAEDVLGEDGIRGIAG